jgi:hypothetical protein
VGDRRPGHTHEPARCICVTAELPASSVAKYNSVLFAAIPAADRTEGDGDRGAGEAFRGAGESCLGQPAHKRSTAELASASATTSGSFQKRRSPTQPARPTYFHGDAKLNSYDKMLPISDILLQRITSV